MPQVWLTYQELGDFLDIDPRAVRDFAIDRGMPRRQCSDGLTRVKMAPDLADDYIRRYSQTLAPRAITFDRPQPSANRFEPELVADLLEAAHTAGIDVTSLFSHLLRDIAMKGRAPMALPDLRTIEHRDVAT